MIKKNSDDKKISILDYVVFIVVVFLFIYFFKGFFGIQNSTDVLQSILDKYGANTIIEKPLNSESK